MYWTSENYQEAFYQSNIFRFYFDDLKIGIIDIETTGLNPVRSQLVLGGLLIPDFPGKKTIQIFSESKAEESSLLQSYLLKLKNLDVLVSYNGEHFDLPFLKARMQYHHIPCEALSQFQSFDLYRILDRYSTLRKLLPNLKQKTVETFLGLWQDREDKISGAESVELYHCFLRTGDPVIRNTILLHNKDDLLQLSRLMKVLEKLNLHKIMFHIGFIVSHQDKKIRIQRIDSQRDSILVSGVHKNIPMGYRCYQASHEALFSSVNHDFILRIPWKTVKGYTYIDLEEFSYDFSELEKYPGFQSGYLVVMGDGEINYAEVNHLIKFILKEILKEL